MKDHFALLPAGGGPGIGVIRNDGILVAVGGYPTTLTPHEARQLAAALERLAALRPVPA